MSSSGSVNSSEDFLKSLGFPTLEVHQTFTHFDFTRPGRRVLLIGPMGSGKTEFAAKVWRDASIAMRKSDKVKALTSTGDVDRRKVFFIRSKIDGSRFTEYPEDAMAFRSGYISCGENIARIRDSFDPPYSIGMALAHAAAPECIIVPFRQSCICKYSCQREVSGIPSAGNDAYLA